MGIKPAKIGESGHTSALGGAAACDHGRKHLLRCNKGCRIPESGVESVIFRRSRPLYNSPFSLLMGRPSVALRHTMNRLSAILPASQVLVDVDASSKKRVFEHAGLLFENHHAIARATVTDNLFARERLGSTGLGHGVAIPHGRIKGLKNPLAAVIRLSQPIPFDAPDEEPVGLLIFLLVPEAATQRHLEILSEIAELLSDRELRERLKSDGSAAEVHGFIERWQPLKSVA